MAKAESIRVLERIGVRVSARDTEAMQRGLAFLVSPIRVKSGCLDCRLLRDVKDTNVFYLEVGWESMGRFLDHARSDLYRTLLEILETASDAPRIEYHEISSTQGLELLECARNGEFLATRDASR